MSALETAPGLVLAGVLPGGVQRLQRAAFLPPEAFGKDDQSIWKAVQAYYARYRAVLPTQTLAERVRKIESEEVRRKIAERWAHLLGYDVPDDQFQWALESTLTAWRDGQAAEAIASAGRMLLGGEAVKDRYGNERVVRGYAAMREHLSRRFTAIDSVGNAENPSVDLRDDYHDAIADYGSAKASGSVVIPSGVEPLDSLLLGGGFRLGELALVAGYAGEGKTTFAITVLAYRAVLLGFNVLYATGETLRSTVRRRLIVRHTHAPQFGLPGGVPVNGVASGSLQPVALNAYQGAAADLTQNENYGRFVSWQMPLHSTFEGIVGEVQRREAEFPVHVLVVDSVDMLRSSGDYRDQISRALEDCASLAVSHDNGRGLLVVSPYQIKRAAYERALNEDGRYTLDALAETALAERRASVVLSLLALPENPRQLRAQVLKNREGAKGEFMLEANYAHAYVGASAGGYAQNSFTASALMGT